LYWLDSLNPSLQAQAETSKNTRSSEFHATGGDTITFQKDDQRDWVHSIRSTQNWRIIRYRKMQELGTAPGLDIELNKVSAPGPEIAADEDSGIKTEDANGTSEPRTVRELLKERLKVGDSSSHISRCPDYTNAFERIQAVKTHAGKQPSLYEFPLHPFPYRRNSPKALGH
jgi:hypothetical protein